MQTSETIVMSVGGSLIVPGEIDTAFLANLKTFITEQTATHGRRFILIAGGGKTARKYQDAAAAVAGDTPSQDLDWLGIHSTRLNGHLLRTIFRDIAHPEMITNPDDIQDVPNTPAVIVASGYRPGASTDLRAVQIATHVGAHKVINLSNISHVYSADPRVDDTAYKIDHISWADFRALIPTEWDPGLSSPFDPIAARTAHEHNIEVATIHGHNQAALEQYLAGEAFEGTVIS